MGRFGLYFAGERVSSPADLWIISGGLYPHEEDKRPPNRFNYDFCLSPTKETNESLCQHRMRTGLPLWLPKGESPDLGKWSIKFSLEMVSMKAYRWQAAK